jgi:Fe2+ transport system protein FeoA
VRVNKIKLTGIYRIRKVAYLYTTLKDLKPGQSGIVVSIGGERTVRRRLIDMGITPGVEVTMKKAAPFGDPVEIFLRGYSLGLRKSDAGKIKLRMKR